jgi:Zn finger protein HypA/HybF involved in hydrogenase expression
MSCEKCGRRTPRSRLCATCQREEDRKQDAQAGQWADYECPSCGKALSLAEGRECPACQSDRYQLVDGEHKRVGDSDIDELFGGDVA